MGSYHVGELADQRADLKSLQRQAVVFVQQRAQRSRQFSPVRGRGERVHLRQGVHDDVYFLADAGEDHDDDLGGHFFGDRPGLAEIDQADGRRRIDQDVARVQVGMEHADLEHLIEVGLDQSAGDELAPFLRPGPVSDQGPEDRYRER